MYEARQNKEKVYRRIDATGRSRQRKKMENYRKNPFTVGNVIAQHPVIQAVNSYGFRTIKEEENNGYITLVVDRKSFGHTYIVIETKEGVWMYHFKANATNGLTKFAKLFAWKGTFERIEKNNGQDPQPFVKNRDMSFSELEVTKEKAQAIIEKCDSTMGGGFFSLALSNIKIGNNCFSKVYNILKEAGFQLTWSSYLLSFISPRLALWLGNGFYDKESKEKKSSFSYK